METGFTVVTSPNIALRDNAMGEAGGPNPRQVGRVVKGILVSGDQLLIFVVVVVVVFFFAETKS